MSDLYLTRNGLERALEQGRTVEQWLGTRVEGGDGVLKWLSIERLRTGRTIVRLVEVLDEGNPHFLDVYEFTPYDADADLGVIHEFDSPDDALEYAVVHLGADSDRFVNEGGVQDEYAAYLKTRK
jgi:hypothetical protein